MPLYRVADGWVAGRSRIVHPDVDSAVRFANRRRVRVFARDQALLGPRRSDARRPGGPFSGRVPRFSDRLETMHREMLQSRWELIYNLVMKAAKSTIKEQAAQLEEFKQAKEQRADSATVGALRTDAASIDEVIRAIRGKLDDIVEGDAEGLALIGREIDEDTTDATDRELSRLFALPIATQVPAQDVRAWVLANVDFSRSLLDKGLDALERTADEAMLAVAAGKPTLTLAKEYQRRFDLTWHKASFLARDQTANLSAAIAQQRMESLGVEEYQWSTVGDSRVRQEHADLDGTIHKWSQPPVASDAGDRGHPGELWQCLPGDADVSLCHLARVAYRRWFSGDLTEIVTATGETLRSTPNHPILTRRGWVPAHLVEVGEDVFRATGNGHVKIADVFAEFWDDGEALTTPCVPESFHGDGCPSVVEIAKVDPGPRRAVSDDDEALLNAVALNRETGALRAVRVSSVRQAPFSGYVYNLETDSGWYVADGLVVHNCRCVALPVLKAGAEERAQLIAEADARKQQELDWMQASPTVKGEIPNQSGFQNWNKRRLAAIKAGKPESVGLPPRT